MAIQHEIIKFDNALLLRLTGSLEAEALADLDGFLKAALQQAEGVMVVGLKDVRPMVATSLGRILACSKPLASRGGALVLVLPEWLGSRAAQVERTIQQQGVGVVTSEAAAFGLHGITVDESLLNARTVGDAATAAEAVEDVGEEEREGHLAELQEGLTFWINAMKGKDAEGQDGLDEDDLDEVAGGAAGGGSPGGLLGELKQGLKYWMGR